VLDTSVSFTKGCYTGQELVLRIDSRGGNVPRLLRGVVIATNVLPPIGASIVPSDDGSDGSNGGDAKEVGRLTSIAESLDRRAPVALAAVSRRVEPPAMVRVVWDDRSVPARVEELPLLRD
jgi:folate-binding Fe-S cluster repair protein YgfZ